MKQYKTYKDSGVEWLGKIPVHWNVSKFGFEVKISRGAGYQHIEQTEEDDYEPIIRIADFKEFNPLKAKRSDELSKYKVQKGDILIAGTGATAGISIMIKNYMNEMVHSYNALRLKSKGVDSKLLFYLLNSHFVEEQKNIAFTGSAQPFLDIGRISNFIIPLPNNKEEQTQIANYLNHKTAQLDSLIAKKEQLISLLQEERTAMINQAVTKGLDPNVLMKNVDVDGLDEIPEHWKLMKFKWLAPILTCGVASTPEYVDESIGVPFLSAQNVKNNKMRLDKYKYISVDLHEKLTKYRMPLNGDILVTRVGAGIGDACIVDCDFEFSVYVSLTHIRVDESIVSNKFIMYFFSTDYCKFLNNYGTVTGGGVGNLNVNNVERYKIPIPSLDEQNSIVEYIEQQNKKSNKIKDKLKQEIDLLKEYKTVLISEVVTGKIDVREEVLN